jgi:hypothetical protein
MHLYKLFYFKCGCGDNLPQKPEVRIQLMVSVPIVPVPVTGKHKVKLNGQPCEIWRNVNTRTQEPVEHVAAPADVALSPWTNEGKLSHAAKQFIKRTFSPAMKWNEMKQKFLRHFPGMISLGPSGYINAAHDYFKTLKKKMVPPTSADGLKGGIMHGALEYLHDQDIFNSNRVPVDGLALSPMPTPQNLQHRCMQLTHHIPSH